jgi:hypothetical protein
LCENYINMEDQPFANQSKLEALWKSVSELHTSLYDGNAARETQQELGQYDRDLIFVSHSAAVESIVALGGAVATGNSVKDVSQIYGVTAGAALIMELFPFSQSLAQAVGGFISEVDDSERLRRSITSRGLDSFVEAHSDWLTRTVRNETIAASILEQAAMAVDFSHQLPPV